MGGVIETNLTNMVRIILTEVSARSNTICRVSVSCCYIKHTRTWYKISKLLGLNNFEARTLSAYACQFTNLYGTRCMVQEEVLLTCIDRVPTFNISWNWIVLIEVSGTALHSRLPILKFSAKMALQIEECDRWVSRRRCPVP